MIHNVWADFSEIFDFHKMSFEMTSEKFFKSGNVFTFSKTTCMSYFIADIAAS